jgi:hypothetical protein
MEVRCEEHAHGRESKTKRAECESFFLAEIVSNGSGGHAAGNASYQCAPCGPSYARSVQMKQLAQIPDRAADHDVVVAKQKAAKSGNAGCNNERGTRLRRTQWGVQVI